jgi:hypothetical protein
MWRRDMTAGRMGNVAMAQVRLNVGAGVTDVRRAVAAHGTQYDRRDGEQRAERETGQKDGLHMDL